MFEDRNCYFTHSGTKFSKKVSDYVSKSYFFRGHDYHLSELVSCSLTSEWAQRGNPTVMGSRFPKGHQIDLGGIDGGVGIGQLCTFCGQSKFVISFHQRCFKRTASNFPSPLRLDFVRSWAKNVVKSYESRVFFYHATSDHVVSLAWYPWSDDRDETNNFSCQLSFSKSHFCCGRCFFWHFSLPLPLPLCHFPTRSGRSLSERIGVILEVRVAYQLLFSDGRTVYSEKPHQKQQAAMKKVHNLHNTEMRLILCKSS